MKPAFVAVVVAIASVALVAQAPDRSKPPALGPAPTLKLPQIQKRQLSNGLPVWIVELHEVPVAQVNLIVMAGTADDPQGKFGTASLTTAMLTEGAGSRAALDIADAVDFLGADLGASSANDSSAIRLHVPVARLADALQIMADVALRPTFPKDELERLRQQRLTSLIQSRDDAATIAALARAILEHRRRFFIKALFCLWHNDQLDTTIERQKSVRRGPDVRRRQRPIARQIFVEPVRIAGVGVVGVQLVRLATKAADTFHPVVERRLDLIDGPLHFVLRRRFALQLVDLLVDHFLHFIDRVARAGRNLDFKIR